MTDIIIEQALLDCEGRCLAHSPGFMEASKSGAMRTVRGFGTAPPGVRCPWAVFAVALAGERVAVVQVAETEDGMRFHFLEVDRSAYERFLGDPFVLAKKFPASWVPSELPTLSLPAAPPPQRTVDDVRRVLKRVKAAALKEGEDPENPAERTMENSESPALLGGVQILVDGGKLVFERPAPDPDLLEGLWTLLPQTTRARLWPASFAFSNELGFDVVVLPHVPLPFEQGYTLEEHAVEYPEGRYELSLQTAAEAGDQAELDALFRRRSSHDTLRLAAILLIILTVAVLLIPGPREPEPEPPPVVLTPAQRLERGAGAAGAISVANPWTTLLMLDQGNRLFLNK